LGLIISDFEAVCKTGDEWHEASREMIDSAGNETYGSTTERALRFESEEGSQETLGGGGQITCLGPDRR